ncbi:hypothetical protein SPI_04908 [Niveomyces insectorum RCEF 264]|uniref:Uncharacterized protein n=1 Tax=Niveomyces insectorum RCEF 264 TaxID=1081102 RepID=A0A167UYZ4_9HYPO|nr:hypothetical protein SPI_04908 [Niveomyces insectorum RCEF 264]
MASSLVGSAEDRMPPATAQDDAHATELNTAADAAAAPTGQPYRAVRPLPFELRDHIRVFLEERMYAEAIQLLTSLLAAGGSEQLGLGDGSAEDGIDGGDDKTRSRSATSPTTTTTPAPPVWIPPPSHLALLATLAVHPAYTTRPRDATDRRVAGHALQYLRHLLVMVGPVQAGMCAAFAFQQQGRTSGHRGHPYHSHHGRRRRGRSSTATTTRRTVSANSARAPARSLRRLRKPARSSLHAESEYVDSSTIRYSDEEEDEEGDEKDEDKDSGKKILVPAHAATAGNSDDEDGIYGVYALAGRHGHHDEDDRFDRGHHDDEDDDHDHDATANDGDAVGGRLATRDSADLAARLAAVRVGHGDDENKEDDDNDDDHLALDQALLLQYLDGASSSHTQLRRIATILLADGSQPVLLQPVFEKEMVVAEAEAEAGTGTADVDEDEKDRNHGSASPGSPTPGRAGRTASTRPAGPSSGSSPHTSSASSPGFQESLPLRHRLFYLLILASLYFPGDVARPDVVYRAFAEVLREADVDVFAAFWATPLPLPLPLPVTVTAASTTTTTPGTMLPAPSPGDVLVGLLRHLLSTYLPAAAPKPRTVDRVAADAPLGAGRAVSPAILECCVLPFAANTMLPAANVRMALAIESLFRLLWTDGADGADRAGRADSPTPQILPVTKPRNADAAARDRALLRRSGQRLLTMVQLTKMEAEG